MRRFLFIAALLLFLTDILHAQAPRAPGGFWYGFGLGASALRVDCSICRTDVHAGTAAQLHAGPGTHAQN